MPTGVVDEEHFDIIFSDKGQMAKNRSWSDLNVTRTFLNWDAILQLFGNTKLSEAMQVRWEEPTMKGVAKMLGATRMSTGVSEGYAIVKRLEANYVRGGNELKLTFTLVGDSATGRRNVPKLKKQKTSRGRAMLQEAAAQAQKQKAEAKLKPKTKPKVKRKKRPVQPTASSSSGNPAKKLRMDDTPMQQPNSKPSETESMPPPKKRAPTVKRKPPVNAQATPLLQPKQKANCRKKSQDASQVRAGGHISSGLQRRRGDARSRSTNRGQCPSDRVHDGASHQSEQQGR